MGCEKPSNLMMDSPSTKVSSISKPSYQQKHHLRALFRSISLVALVAVFCAYNYWHSGQDTLDEFHRRLDDEDEASAAPCENVTVADPKWHLVFYILGVLYMFLALAIVCDEFFVPALEEMSSERHLNLSMDVAGATLMAAGGSAPELFTALFGTFKESDVGFGTIVGSAVFNVLFVIGMCSLLSKELLQLTWWPLFRDSVYYIIGLVVLATFVGVTSAGEIELWEACVLFVLYLGYVLVMAYNERLYTLINGKFLGVGAKAEAEDDFVVVDEEKVTGAFELHESSGDFKDEETAEAMSRRNQMTKAQSFLQPGSFRAGIVKLIRDPKSWTGISLVTKIKGDVNTVFSHVDTDGDQMVNKEELRKVFEELKCDLNDTEFDQIYDELDEDKSGMIDKDEFTKWYLSSEKRMLSKVQTVFKELDTNNSGTVDRTEVRTLLESIDPTVSEAEVTAALMEMTRTGEIDEIAYEEFAEWYAHSLVFQHQKEEAEEESEGIFASLRPPRGNNKSVFAYAKYILLLPLVITLAFTVPDVRRPGLGKFSYLSFFLSIAWIGLYSFFMVDWAEIIGATLGIPDIIMGLTFLAAGTSVPDLLSSVIVARRGEGDMAVSSSIGSNIFDILVGLPLPWIAYTAYPGKPDTVAVGAEGVGVSITILVAMIALIIVTIHLNGWKLTKTAGYMMFVFYVAFVVQAVIRELPFQTCG
uniref:EF-hand domain-containing protein n=1 Tax=Odontella aurita TaxID=265563 RepID=A0A7S4JC99_9STRA|mmetsp:Transcript_43592/g.132676  ORF Transcript_43592/g.132676 Transcript_43592/m.132676 type:complete len:701 (+) Transcript_43592:55-2157(+)